MSDLTIKPIGFVSSAFTKHGDTPRQGKYTDELSRITILPEYTEALDGLHPGDDIFIFSWFDRADRSTLKSHIAGDEKRPIKGVFANRSPNRPNPIALTLVRLIETEGNILVVKGLEAFDGTPVADIKPFSAHLDIPGNESEPQCRSEAPGDPS